MRLQSHRLGTIARGLSEGIGQFATTIATFGDKLRQIATACDKWLRQFWNHIYTACRGFYITSLLTTATMSSCEANWDRHLDDDIDSLLGVLTLHVLQRILDRRRQKPHRRPRVCWVKPWLQRRHQLGAYDGLMVELANEDVEGYVAFQRMAPDLFAELLSKVGPIIQRHDTVMRKSISPGARLALTLRYLATGKYVWIVYTML